MVGSKFKDYQTHIQSCFASYDELKKFHIYIILISMFQYLGGKKLCECFCYIRSVIFIYILSSYIVNKT
jgi:hypothetical protein